jgi:ADP-ribose pyrophosphatase YjhB (NUDIX family)
MSEPLPKLGKTESGEDLHYSAGAIIKNDKGEFLIIERAKFPPGFAGPAGHVDEGETGEEAIP